MKEKIFSKILINLLEELEFKDLAKFIDFTDSHVIYKYFHEIIQDEEIYSKIINHDTKYFMDLEFDNKDIQEIQQDIQELHPDDIETVWLYIDKLVKCCNFKI